MKIGHFIGGEWISAAAGRGIPVENPASGEIFAEVPAGGRAEAERALDAASAAAKAWARTPAVARAAYLQEVAGLLRERVDSFAETIMSEQGKPLTQARGEVMGTALHLDYHAQWARRIEGDTLASENSGEHILILRVPYGVVVGLIPWNYPLSLTARKVAPALIAGNTIVVKPHEVTPLSALRLAALFEEVGLPRGVLNVVTGTGTELGEALVGSKKTNLVTLTGSVRAGREVMRRAADNIIQVSLELGGKAPLIVCEDADLDYAAERAVFARFRNCGQVCTSNERTYVQEAVFQPFMEKFLARVQSLGIGDPRSDPDVGPKVSRVEVEKVEAMVARAVEQGARVLTGGGRMSGGPFDRGHWFQPTVLTNLHPSMDIVRQEVFGPVASVISFTDFDDALQQANDSDYGLSAYLFTHDYRKVMRAVNELEFGEVYVNRVGPEAVNAYHTGYRLSGIGGDDGRYGFETYMRKKTVYLSSN
ncbi:aldehyde dehydrogenase [Mesorhizobium sp. BAC0120]|uniref:aldehyde dehydrogenase n=1 Tax=Mesorhizobium sp. BAC0120 TaxID=3090670 RepID=UPI00298CC2A4|nr:aldehyde dehydrogenase [Mesorhizobium sp. BAC0120]MDW6024737.1 aldehyde dehydrogenase [Mesorhizobium sp. BAC0120]